MDEMYHGGKDKWKHEVKKPHAGRGAVSKTPVFGMAQRGVKNEKGKFTTHGKVSAVVVPVPDTTADTLISEAKVKVLPASSVFTDEHPVLQRPRQARVRPRSGEPLAGGVRERRCPHEHD